MACFSLLYLSAGGSGHAQLAAPQPAGARGKMRATWVAAHAALLMELIT
jgi:hypothetical protein